MAKTTAAKRVYFTSADDALDLLNLVDHQNRSF